MPFLLLITIKAHLACCFSCVNLWSNNPCAKKTKTRGSFRCSDGGEANPKMTVVSGILVTKRAKRISVQKLV